MAARRRYSRTPEVAAQQRQGRVESVPATNPLVSNAGGVRAATQHPTQGPSREQSGYEQEHYGGDPGSHSDLERMRAGGGTATGRRSPRIPQRVNVANAVLVHRGLASPGDVDPNQGRLLSHAQMGHLTKSDAEMSEQTGVPYRRPAGQGWMTGVGQTARRPYGSSAEARAAGDEKAASAIGQRKADVGAVAREKLGSDTPARSALQNRARYETDKPTNWYAEGAHGAITHEALKSGLGGNPRGFDVMRRATALTSPQKPWDAGHGQDDNYRMENVDVAGHLVRHLSGEQERLGKDYDPKQAALSFRMPGMGHSEEHPNLVEGQSKNVRKSVAQHLDMPTHEGPALATDVQKVRNFDVALNAGHQTRWARRQAAQAYTSDTHDQRAAGISGIYQQWVGAPASSGGYEFAAMTGRRGAMRQSAAALKRGAEPRTSSEYQEDTWNGRRGPNQPKIHEETRVAGGRAQKVKGRQTLFQPGPNGTERVSPLAVPHPSTGNNLNAEQFKQSSRKAG